MVVDVLRLEDRTGKPHVAAGDVARPGRSIPPTDAWYTKVPVGPLAGDDGEVGPGVDGSHGIDEHGLLRAPVLDDAEAIRPEEPDPQPGYQVHSVCDGARQAVAADSGEDPW